MIKVSLKNLLYTCRNDIYSNIFIYPIAIPLSWVIIKFTKISANSITIFSFLETVIFSAISIYSSNLVYLLIGFLCFYILDYVDGRVAWGRSSGSTFGAKLDFIVDRTILMVVIFTLTYYHLVHDHILELFILNIFGILFFWLDSVAYASFIKVVKDEDDSFKIKDVQLIHSGLKLFLHFPNYIPNKLNSYLFIIISYFFSQSFVIAYMVGIFVLLIDIVFNYFKQNNNELDSA